MRRLGITTYLIAALAMLGVAPSVHAETTILSEPCNKTDSTVVWFEALYQTVILTTTTQDSEDGNVATRHLTLQDGRQVDLPAGRHFLYDATGISCESYIAVAKSTVLESLASGQLYDLDIHADYKAMLRGESPCATADQSQACFSQDVGTLHIQPLSTAQLQTLNDVQHAVLTIRAHAFGVTTYALNLTDFSLTALYYDGT